MHDQIPGEEATGTSPLHSFTLSETSNADSLWTLALYPDRLTITPDTPGTPGPAGPPGAMQPGAMQPGAMQPPIYPQPPPGATPMGYPTAQPAPPTAWSFAVERDQIGEVVIIHDGTMLKRNIELRRPGDKKRFFQLTPDEFSALTDWIGPPSQRMLAAELKRRTAFLVPVGLFIAATSLPCSGDTSGGKAIGLNVAGMALGAALLVIYLLGRYRPRPWVFLLDTLWWMGLLADSIYPVITGTSHPAWLALTPLSVYLSWLAIRQYRRFAGVTQT